MSVANVPLLGAVAATAAAIPAGLYFGSTTVNLNSSEGGSSQEPRVPSHTTIFEKDTDAETYKDKFGKDFARHFVSATDANNEAWWNHVFTTRWVEDTPKAPSSGASTAQTTDPRSSEFQNIGKGWGDTTQAKSLSKVCADAYNKTTVGEVHDSAAAANTNKPKYEKDIWRYCSVKGKVPVVLANSEIQGESEYKNPTSENTKIGQVKNKSLISTEDPKNEWFWTVQELAFFTDDGFGKSLTSSDPVSTFKTLYSKKEEESRDTLKKTCKEAYAKPTSSNDQEQKDALKFCSLSGKKTS